MGTDSRWFFDCDVGMKSGAPYAVQTAMRWSAEQLAKLKTYVVWLARQRSLELIAVALCSSNILDCRAAWNDANGLSLQI